MAVGSEQADEVIAALKLAAESLASIARSLQKIANPIHVVALTDEQKAYERDRANRIAARNIG